MQIDTTTSYPNNCDPFYSLDDPMPDKVSEKNKNIRYQKQPDMVATATFIAQLNAGKRSSRLKQFLENEQALRRSDY